MITLPSDPEKLAGLQKACDNYNEVNSTSWTLEEYASILIDAQSEIEKMKAIDIKGQSLIDAAKSMPDSHRIIFTSVVESIIQKIAVTPEQELESLKTSILQSLE